MSEIEALRISIEQRTRYDTHSSGELFLEESRNEADNCLSTKEDEEEQYFASEANVSIANKDVPRQEVTKAENDKHFTSKSKIDEDSYWRAIYKGVGSVDEGALLNERFSPLLEEDDTSSTAHYHKTFEELQEIGEPEKIESPVASYPEPPLRPPSPQSVVAEIHDDVHFEGQEFLTQEELDHIAAIERLAQESSLAVEPLPTVLSTKISEEPEKVTGEEGELGYTVEPHEEVRIVVDEHKEFVREESEATSGADQEIGSDVGSADEGVPMYERSSPLLEEDDTSSTAHYHKTFEELQEIGEPEKIEYPVASYPEPPLRPPSPQS
ncbi:hypothetical protein ANCCAN_02040, partial [Ancylostoma caninum]